LSGRVLCDELITRPEESYRLCCVVVCDLETSRMGAPYIYDISHLRVNGIGFHYHRIARAVWNFLIIFMWHSLSVYVLGTRSSYEPVWKNF